MTSEVDISDLKSGLPGSDIKYAAIAIQYIKPDSALDGMRAV